MNNITKITNINNNMEESQRKATYIKSDKHNYAKHIDNFDDIYDIRLQSAELNRSSNSFRGIMLETAEKNLNKVIGNLGEIKNTDDIINNIQTDDMIALTRLIITKK